MIISYILINISTFVVAAAVGFPTNDPRDSHGFLVPPKILYQRDSNEEAIIIAKRVEAWSPEDKGNVWELTGLFEGDIMVNPTDGETARNGLLNESKRWPNGIVPIYIDDEDFNEDEIKRIEDAIEEYHRRTCVKFRRYEETDVDYITIKGEMSGCWSSVGRQHRGQVLNLQKKGCMKHGTIVHELLHALGFYHQQSAADRDEYVKIHWGNIKSGREHNFNKYDRKTITDYGIGYDYGSVMHYSGYAFSRNGKPTITTLDEAAQIGQRMELSEKDVAKLEEMYKEECINRKRETEKVTLY